MSKFVYPLDRTRAQDPGSGSGFDTGFVVICFVVAETPDCGTSSGSVAVKNHRGRHVEVRFATGSVRGRGEINRRGTDSDTTPDFNNDNGDNCDFMRSYLCNC